MLGANDYCEFKYSHTDRSGRHFEDYFYVVKDHASEIKKALAGTCIKPTERTCQLKTDVFYFDSSQIQEIYNSLLSRKRDVVEVFEGHNSRTLLSFYSIVKTSAGNCNLLDAMKVLMQSLTENNIVDESKDIVMEINERRIVLNLTSDKITKFKKNFIGAAREINKLNSAIEKVDEFIRLWKMKIKVDEDLIPFQNLQPVDYQAVAADFIKEEKKERMKAKDYYDKPYLELS